MKALLVITYCLTCNSSTISITPMANLDECMAARDALVLHAVEPGFMDKRLTFRSGNPQPQCIEYQVVSK